MFTKAFRTKFAVLAGLTFGAVGSANAVPMTWTDLAGSPGTYLSQGSTYSYQHNILTDGYVPGVDSITSASLGVKLADDALFGNVDLNLGGWWAGLFDKEETVGFKFDGSGWRTDVVDNWLFANDYFNFTVTSLLTDGLLNVTIKAFQGDFVFNGSRLTAHGDRASVPEPGTLGLFGLGMLATGFAARRRRAK